MTELVAITVLSRSKKAASMWLRSCCSRRRPFAQQRRRSARADPLTHRVRAHIVRLPSPRFPRVARCAPRTADRGEAFFVLVCFWSPKGGSGTSVVAATAALVLAREGAARVADLAGDLPAVLGLASDPDLGLRDWLRAGPEAPSEGLDRLEVDAGRGLALLPAGTGDISSA